MPVNLSISLEGSPSRHPALVTSRPCLNAAAEWNVSRGPALGRLLVIGLGSRVAPTLCAAAAVCPADTVSLQPPTRSLLFWALPTCHLARCQDFSPFTPRALSHLCFSSTDTSSTPCRHARPPTTRVSPGPSPKAFCCCRHRSAFHCPLRSDVCLPGSFFSFLSLPFFFFPSLFPFLL